MRYIPENVNAMLELGRRINSGEIAEQVEKEGLIWLSRAANRDLSLLPEAANAGDVNSIYLLSFELFRGKIFPRDIKEAKKWLEKLAACEEEKATDHLLYMCSLLIEGKILPENKPVGVKWLSYIMGNNPHEKYRQQASDSLHTLFHLHDDNSNILH